ncbi:MAG: META domain-containing protein [Dehalococcoidales bacterium]
METALPRLLAMGMVIALLATAACGPSVVGPEGKSWLLASYGDAAAPETPPAGVEASAEFVDGQMMGSAGCNAYFGAYETDGSDMAIGPVAATEMWCESPEGAMDLEQAFLTAIGAAETFEVEDGELRIDYPGGVLTFTAR